VNIGFRTSVIELFGVILNEHVHPTTKVGMKDFFISYNKADRQWAEWIAWQLEEAGYSLIIQEWDFRPGGNFVIEMQKALEGTKKTIAVLSESYLNSEFTQPEWAAVFAKDPQSLQRNLLLVKVGECKRQGLLTPLIYVSLLDVDEPTARNKLLSALKDRDKPDQPPFFPGNIPAESISPELRTIEVEPLFPSNEIKSFAQANKQQVQSYLMIKIEPSISISKQSNKSYFVKAWFIANEQEYNAQSGMGAVPLATAEDEDFADTEEVFTIAEIEKILPAFIFNSAGSGLPPNLTIELFLPDELLNESIDNWEMDDGNSVYPIGSKYKIILRSAQRLQQRQLKLNGGFWQQKWKNMPKPGEKQSTDLLVAGDKMSYECLLQKLEPAHIMGLNFVGNSLQIGKNSPVTALRAAGAPIAIWLRQPLPNVDQTTIDSLLACCLHDLPSVVKQQRFAAISEESGSHIGHHIALLWDNFDRLPPDLDFYMS
jgi:hypothetical protein